MTKALLKFFNPWWAVSGMMVVAQKPLKNLKMIISKNSFIVHSFKHNNLNLKYWQ